MNQTCDRCGPAAYAAYRVDRGGELYLCGHCTNLLGPALWSSGTSRPGWNREAGPVPVQRLNGNPT